MPTLCPPTSFLLLFCTGQGGRVDFILSTTYFPSTKHRSKQNHTVPDPSGTLFFLVRVAMTLFMFPFLYMAAFECLCACLCKNTPMTSSLTALCSRWQCMSACGRAYYNKLPTQKSLPHHAKKRSTPGPGQLHAQKERKAAGRDNRASKLFRLG